MTEGQRVYHLSPPVVASSSTLDENRHKERVHVNVSLKKKGRES